MHLSWVGDLSGWLDETDFHETRETGFLLGRLEELWQRVPRYKPLSVGVVRLHRDPLAEQDIGPGTRPRRIHSSPRERDRGRQQRHWEDAHCSRTGAVCLSEGPVGSRFQQPEPTDLSGTKNRAASVRLKAKLSNLAEFFGTILVSMAMNTSSYREAAEPSRAPPRRYQVKRRRILIVEDDPLSLIVLRQLLTAQGHEILQSSEGWGGINRARNEQPDLIVMDIKLPDISGLDATLLLKKDDQTKNIPIIVVTACITPEDKAKALKSGCDAYIAKPVNMANLLRTVELVLPASSP